jgi:serine/threonine-protein kinase RsbW
MGVAGSSHSSKDKSKAARGGGRSRKNAAARAAGAGGHEPLVFTIPSDLGASRDVHKAIMDRVEGHRFGEQSSFAIRLALEEGLMNAIKHGNKLDPNKTVHVEATVTPREAQITIEDQGPGFDRSDVPDPCASENLLKCSGRGILLMEAYMDKVQYSRGGRRVKMVKKNA